MPETRNIVFLGASYGGLGSAHYFLQHTYPHLPTDRDIIYQVKLVDPSSKWYIRHASPRAVASAELLPTDKMFLDIEPGFKRYGEAFEFIQGKAVSWDVKARTVTIEKTGGDQNTMAYYALILATGSKTYSPLYSPQGSTYLDIQKALDVVHSKLSTAREVVIAGGGPTGVETAGELGDSLNGSPGWFSFGTSNPKTNIILITNSEKLLPLLKPWVGKQAEHYLNRLGVQVCYSTKVSSTSVLPSGRTKVVLNDGEEIETDVYIPSMGVRPMSEYVPEQLKDGQGFVKQNNETLRVDGGGQRVYAIGDVGTYSRNTIVDILDSIPVLETNLRRDLVAAHVDPNSKPVGPDRLYKPGSSETQLVPVGRNKGVGAVFGWTVPSWFVWLMKGRDYMVSKAAQQIDGSNWAKEVAWKASA